MLKVMAFRYVFPRESETVNTCPDLPARITTAMKFPAVLLEAKESKAEVVVPASVPTC